MDANECSCAGKGEAPHAFSSAKLQIGLLTNNRKRKGRQGGNLKTLGENEDFGDKFVVGSFEFF
jgi:hypothetical protein